MLTLTISLLYKFQDVTCNNNEDDTIPTFSADSTNPKVQLNFHCVTS